MCALFSATPRGASAANAGDDRQGHSAERMVMPERGADLGNGAGYSLVNLGDSLRLALMVTPRASGPFEDQLEESLATLTRALERQPQRMEVTAQTVFLRDAADQAQCERVFAAFYGRQLPVTTYVQQPPCCGAGLAIEAWAIGGEGVRIDRFGPQALAVSYDRVRWVYCAGLAPEPAARGVHSQTLDTLRRMESTLAEARSRFSHVVRTWFYLGAITDAEGGFQRYQELNRGRTDYYRTIHFQLAAPAGGEAASVYPASTGIGMTGTGLVASCMALDTDRADAKLIALENPQQTPAYAYESRYSPQSPKFSRAMALVLGDYVTTWVSGTASIVDAESRHPGDVERQTNQTIDNIERLIAAKNFAAHGVRGAGACLRDLAKVRVYVKRAVDFPRCRAVCESRFGNVPAIYAVADVCRPELLVEIEGVAFSKLEKPAGVREK